MADRSVEPGMPGEPLGEGLSDAEIRDGERRLGVALPDVYRRLLTRANGYRLRDVVIDGIPVRVLSGFRQAGAGVMPEDLAGFNAYFTEEKRHRPAGSFFFAHSPAGSFVVFHRGRRAGRVAFVDRATRAARVVAESMQVFLDALRVAETVGAAPPEHASSKPRLPDAKPGRLQLPRRPQHWEDVDFRRARLPRSAVVRDVHAIRCTFGGASTDARSFTKFERVVLEQPVVATRHLMNVIARHASVHGCASGAKPLSLVNFYFDRVRLTGEFGSWLIRQDSDRLPANARMTSQRSGALGMR